MLRMIEAVEYGWWLSPPALVGFGIGFLLLGLGVVLLTWRR